MSSTKAPVVPGVFSVSGSIVKHKFESDESDDGGGGSDDEPPNGDALSKDLDDAVRIHVFNNMPIRLLHLPDMVLIERGSIIRLITDKINREIGSVGFNALLDTSTYSDSTGSDKEANVNNARSFLIKDLVERHSRYAILSHTWLQRKPEVIFRDTQDLATWESIKKKQGTGYRKLEGFCRVVNDSLYLSLAWMDTICINKDSTSELEESIRSMYRWYNKAYICVIYLAQTISFSDIHCDRWFTRGWTLQELLAPARVKFYNKKWTSLTGHENDKVLHPSESSHSRTVSNHILQILRKTTGIDQQDLLDFQPGVGRGIASRMVWAAKRVSTRGEDRAYSLMGIFNVSFSIAYGEGAERAFFRLLEAILSAFRNPLDILNWAGAPSSTPIHASRILPSSPECYLRHSAHVDFSSIVPERPMLLTHIGLQVRLMIIYAKLIDRKAESSTSESLQLSSAPANTSLQFEALTRNGCFEVKSPVPANLCHAHPPFYDEFAFVFGIWGFHEGPEYITIPTVCPALLFCVPGYTVPPDTVKWTNSGSTVRDLVSRLGLKPGTKVNTQEPILLSFSKCNTRHNTKQLVHITERKTMALNDYTMCISTYL